MSGDTTLREHAKRIAPAGGKARQVSMSDEERRAFAASGGEARTGALTAKRRKEIASDAAKARWAKKKRKEAVARKKKA